MKKESVFGENIYYKEEILHIDGIKCTDLLENYKNPILVYSADRIKSNIQNIKRAFLSCYDKCEFYFAYKACYIPEVFRVIHENGFFAEVTSSYECKMALKSSANKIIWNSPAKTSDEVQLAIENNVIINADSKYEIDMINEYAMKKGINVGIGLRLCPEIPVSSYIARGGKLGIDIKSGQALELCEYIKTLPNVTLIGLHSHMSVENIDPYNHVIVLECIVDFARQLNERLGIKVEYISSGGGFASRDEIEKKGKGLENFAQEMCKVVRKLGYEPKLIIEPGRYVVNDAAIGIGKIINIKKNAATTWWITDMGTNLLIPFAGRRFPVIPVCKNNNEQTVVNIGDRTSSYTGVIDEGVCINKMKIGDFLCMTNCGSYTFSCAQNYMYPITNTFLMICEGKVKKILNSKSEDEYIDDLF